MTHCYRFDDVRIDVRNFQVFKGEQALALEPKPLRVLTFLIENRGRLVEKSELMNAVWKDAFVTENVLTRAIAHLRKLLCDDARKPRYIQTVPTRGYRFIATVETRHTEVDSLSTVVRDETYSHSAKRNLAAVAIAVILTLLLLAGMAAVLLRIHLQAHNDRHAEVSSFISIPSQFLHRNSRNHLTDLNT